MIPADTGRFIVVRTRVTTVPKVLCPDCERRIAMHELETNTVAQSSGFATTYRCPFCRHEVEDVTEHLE